MLAHMAGTVFLGLGECVALIKAFSTNPSSLTAWQLWIQTTPGDSCEEDVHWEDFSHSFRVELETEVMALLRC